MESENALLKQPVQYLFKKASWLGDSFFIIQLMAAVWFGYAQVGTFLGSVEGASISWMGLWLAFVIINLGLAIGASKKESDRVIVQTIGNYSAWTFVIGLAFFTLLLQGASWNEIDTVTIIITGAGVVGLFIYGQMKGLALFDPVMRGGLALLFKFIPQLTLAVNVWLYGGRGIALYTVLVGHFIISMRIGQIWMSARKTGWDKHRVGVVVGEAGNEISWIVLTIVWFLVL